MNKYLILVVLALNTQSFVSAETQRWLYKKIYKTAENILLFTPLNTDTPKNKRFYKIFHPKDIEDMNPIEFADMFQQLCKNNADTKQSYTLQLLFTNDLEVVTKQIEQQLAFQNNLIANKIEHARAIIRIACSRKFIHKGELSITSRTNLWTGQITHFDRRGNELPTRIFTNMIYALTLLKAINSD